MKHTVIALVCLIFSSCAVPIVPTSSGTLEEITAPSLQNVGSAALKIVSITPSRISNDEVRLRVQISRNGLTETLRLETAKLPDGLTSNPTALSPQQEQASLTLRGPITSETAIRVHLRSSNRILEQLVSLKSVASGSMYRQSLQLGTANLEPGKFAPTLIYANFSGSLCQVMVQGKSHGLYVCFNGPLKGGQVYPLETARGLHNDTASITYFQSTTASSIQPGFWDSSAGFVMVKSVNKNRIELLLQEVKLEPAKGFADNPAQGEFKLEANMVVEDIFNLPEGSPNAE